MKTKLILLWALCLSLPLALQAASNPVSMETLLIDVPTSEVFDRYQASFHSRAYEHGSFMETIDFGVYTRINMGVSVAAHELVGSSATVRVLKPDFLLKWKLYDGSLYMPAIAIGYDGRRYGYGYEGRKYSNTKKYLDGRKGAYVSLSREVIFPGLNATARMNLSDLDISDLAFFTGLFYRVTEQIGVLTEWDNIHNVRDSRLNMAARFYFHPALALDAGVRRIGRGDESERILQIRYTTNF